jgi:hypothetical protein
MSDFLFDFDIARTEFPMRATLRLAERSRLQLGSKQIAARWLYLSAFAKR